MKIEIERKAAQTALKLTRLASKQPGDQIYSCVRVTAEQPGKLTVQATDLQTSISVSVGATVVEAGTCALPGKALGDVVHAMVGETITLQDQKDATVVTSGGSRCRMLGRLVEDFPLMPVLEDRHILMRVEDLMQLVDGVRYCMSTDLTRPHVCGALLAFGTDGTVTMVATDGHRLSQATFQSDMGCMPFKLFLPATALHQLHDLLGAATGAVGSA